MKNGIFSSFIFIFAFIFLIPLINNKIIKREVNEGIHEVEIERDFKSVELQTDVPLETPEQAPAEALVMDVIDTENVSEPQAQPTEEEQVSKTNIEIRNVQKDNESVTYTYNVIIRDIVGATRYSIDGKESYIVFSSKGEATFTLKSNQTLIIYDIPYNTYYSIEQAANNKYVTSVNDKKQNIMEGVTVQNNIITFNNTSKVINANPNTADYSIIYIASGILSFIALIVLIKTVKVKRFTN